MRSIRVLGVVRSNAAASAVEPLFKELLSRGHLTSLFAEGGGQAAHRLTIPFTKLTERSQLLEAFEEKIDVVVTGLSWRREFEQIAEVEAKRRNIALVHIEDFWGAHVRTNVKADVLLVIDSMAAHMAHVARPGIRTAVVGLPGLFPVVPGSLLRRRLEDARASTAARLIVYPDSGQEALGTLPMLVESIRQTRTPVVLLPKWNPNVCDEASDDGRTWAERCEEIIAPLRREGKVLDVEGPTDEVVLCADLTASGFSVLLFRSLYGGKSALTLWTPFVAQLLKEETGLAETPLMMRGYPVLMQPQPLDAILMQKARSSDSKPFDPAGAADAVLSLDLV